MLNKNAEALYFSRSPVPFLRGSSTDWTTQHTYFKHIGMYAYRTDVLKKITQLAVSALEKAESLEQLRWLENGFKIKTAETQIETLGIDTPEDLKDLRMEVIEIFIFHRVCFFIYFYDVLIFDFMSEFLILLILKFSIHILIFQKIFYNFTIVRTFLKMLEMGNSVKMSIVTL